MTVRILDLNVPPGVDVDFLNAVRKDVLGQKSVLRHFRVQGVHQLRGRHTIHGDAVLLQIPRHAALHLFLGVRVVLCDEGGVGFREIALHLTERLRKGDAFLLWGKEEFACTRCCCSFREERPSGALLKGDIMHLCLFRLSLRFCGGGRGEQGVASSFTKQSEHLLTDPVDLLAECAAVLHGEVCQQLTGQILLLQLLRIR